MIRHFGLDRQYRSLRDELLDASDRVLSSGNLMNGQYTAELEDWIANRTNTARAVTCHSGTQALEIMALYYKHRFMYDVSKKTQGPAIVHVPNLTYPATLNAWLNAGSEVVIEDTDANGLMVTEDDGDDKAHIYCHVGLYGNRPNIQPENSSRINAVDGAQHWLVPGATAGVSSMSISFDPTKNLPSSGNGGTIVTNDDALYLFAMSYRNNSNSTCHSSSGTNSRMSEQDCAQLLVRTQYIDEWQERRRKIATYYCQRFKEMPFRCLAHDVERHAHQKFVIDTIGRNELCKYLYDHGIECKISYDKTLSELPVALYLSKPDMISVSVMLSRGVISLPIYPELTDSEVQYIADRVVKFFDK